MGTTNDSRICQNVQLFYSRYVIDNVGKKLQYFLIMRRAWKKGGTRYNARGIDEKGNVANFC